MGFNEELQKLADDYNRAPESYAATAKLGLFLSTHTHTAEQAMDILVKADSLARSREERVAVLNRLGQLATIFKPRAAACAVYRELYQLFPDSLAVAQSYANELDWNSQPEEAAQVIGKATAQSLHYAVSIARKQGTRPRQLMFAPELLAAFGEIGDTLEAYLKGRRLGLLPDVEAIVPIGLGKVANRFLLDCWRRAAPEITWIDDLEECRHLAESYRNQLLSAYWFPINGEMVYRQDALIRFQRLWDEQGRPPIACLPDDVVERGHAWLRTLGVPADAWFVAVHIRDGGDRSLVADGLNRGRNGDVETALPAIRRIVDAGGWVIRIGNRSTESLTGMPNVIDLTEQPRQDWQDIFLLTQCRFMMGSYSGPSSVSRSFAVPTVCFNIFPHKQIVGLRTRDIVVHKLLRRRDDGRLLSFDEMASPEVLRLFHPKEIHDNGLELVNNTSEDITAAVEQMLRRLSRGDAAPEAEAALNTAYAAIRRRHGLETGAIIGGRFLSAHADLFEDSRP